MKYTKKDSINKIINDTEVSKCIDVFFIRQMLNLVPKRYWDEPLEKVEHEVMMPWGVSSIAESLVDAANKVFAAITEHKYRFIPLWRENEKDYVPDIKRNNKESVSLMMLNTDTESKKPAVIISPGGAYMCLAGDVEGVRLAQKMEEEGYYPFVLYYRTLPNLFPAPQEDLARAIEYVRSHAEEYNIHPDRIMAMGSSAGAHLCASAAGLYKEPERRPNMVCLNYGVINFEKEMKGDDGSKLIGGDERLAALLKVDELITSDYPKTFLWACEDDDIVPYTNTLRMAKALEEKGVEYELHIYPTGGHGCGLGIGTSAEGWIDKMLKFMK